MTTVDEAKTLLGQRRQELTDRLGSIESSRRRLSLEVQPDLDDSARQQNDKEILDRFSEVTREELAQVLHALGRLESGHYGICEHCGSPIGAARLNVVPDATSCARCSAGKRAA